MTPNITISEAAIAHFQSMLDKHPKPDTQLRIYVLHPGTSMGHCGVAYWRPAAGMLEDAHTVFADFKLYYTRSQAGFLDGATIDYRKVFSGQALSLQAPNAKRLLPVDADSPLEQRITYVLETEVNPHLADHSGTVTLEHVRAGGEVTLKFGGSCHGCGQAELTLRDTVATTLRQHFPEISKVVDATDHDTGAAPYHPRETATAA
jgi:Fe/S biogenesis protein NfuA